MDDDANEPETTDEDIPEGDQVYMRIPEGMPENLSELAQMIPLDLPPKLAEQDPGIIQLYERMIDGQCMTCGSDLNDPRVMLIIGVGGIEMATCTHVCFTDMQIVGWLQERLRDLDDAIEFRGKD